MDDVEQRKPTVTVEIKAFGQTQIVCVWGDSPISNVGGIVQREINKMLAASLSQSQGVS